MATNKKKRRKKRRHYTPRFYLAILILIMLIVTLIVVPISCTKRKKNRNHEAPSSSAASSVEAAVSTAVPERATTSASPEDDGTDVPVESEAEADPRLDVLTHYTNLGVVKAESFLNIRETPATDGIVIGKVWRNNGLEILEDLGNGWYRIRTGKVEGYAYAELIATGDEAAALAIANCHLMATVNAECLNVRPEPTLDCTPWTQLNCNEMQAVSNVLDGWLEVMINNTVGYISSDYVKLGYYLEEGVAWSTLDSTTETRRNLINYGTQFLGTPYKYNATSLTEGIDCSGFTQAVFATIGISLHRESYNQKTQGVAVASIDDAQPGDLLFYTDSEGRVNHVAIYIGDGRILHSCESKGGVTITTYNYSTEPAYIKDVIRDN